MLPKSIQTVFQFTLLITSGLALMLIAYRVLNTHYSNNNLIFIGIFTLPVVLSFIFSASLLSDKNK